MCVYIYIQKLIIAYYPFNPAIKNLLKLYGNVSEDFEENSCDLSVVIFVTMSSCQGAVHM